MSHAAPPLLPPVLAGRGEELARIDEIIGEQPGAIAITGPSGSGRARLAREVATRLGGDGVRIVVAQEAAGDAGARLGAALRDQGLPADPRAAGGRAPFIALMGETRAADEAAAALALTLTGTRSVAVFWGDDCPPDLPRVPLGPLGDDDAARLVTGAAPDLSPALHERVLSLSQGRPGRIVALARVAAGRSEFAALSLPAASDVIALPADLSPRVVDILGWAALLTPRFTGEEIAHLTGRGARALEDDLDALSATGLLALTDPPDAWWGFADPLLAEQLLEEKGPARLRRESAAALRAGMSCRRDARSLVARAARAGDVAATCRLSARASEEAREAGDASEALRHAERSLAWFADDLPERLRLDGLAARGRARSALSDWEAASADLDEAASGYAESGFSEERLAAASDSASADWMLGRHDTAFARLAASLSDDAEPDAASAGRAESLADAAGMALATGRVRDAGDLSRRARRVAAACGEYGIAARSLVIATTARVLADGQGDALGDFERAADEARENANERGVSLAAIHHSHALLLLGRPEAAADAARRGVEHAEGPELSDHRLVLLGNLGEALSESGRLEEAEIAIANAADGWRELGREAPSPVDPARARLLLARGHVSDALREYRGIASQLGGDPLFEQLAPASAGHALAAAVSGETAEAVRVIEDALTAWGRTDDRVAIIPLLVVGATLDEIAVRRRCCAALAQLGADGSEPARIFGAVDGADPAALRAAAGRLAENGLAWWSNRMRFVAGNRGEDEAAVEDLHHVRREFRQMDADGWRLRSEAALRARGQRIPSRAEGRPTEANALSAREMEVLAQLALGLRNREIGDELFIAERTVARHVGKILAKLEVPTRTAAVRVGRERGLLPGTIA